MERLDVATYAVSIFSGGFLFGWARGKYGSISNALGVLKDFVKRKIG